jgi:serine/threonine protein kinase
MIKQQTHTALGFDAALTYKAPEVINTNEPTSKANIWAIGIILYKLLYSKHPFQKKRRGSRNINGVKRLRT